MDKITDNIRLHKRFVILNRPAFLARLSVLLAEGYTFHEGLHLLLPHHMNEYEIILAEIDGDFREGLGVTHILGRLGFSSGALLPIAIAEVDGRLADALQGMAIRVKKADDARKRMKSLLAYPSVLFLFISALLIAFRRFFLPNMEALALSRGGNEKGIVSSLPALVSKIPDFIFGTSIVITVLCVVSIGFYRKLSPANKIRFFASLPNVNKLFSMWKTRTFASEMGSLLQSGLSMQDSLDVLIGQSLDPVLGEIANNVKKHVIYGEPFHTAISMTEGLTRQFSSFAQHGANSGHLPKELIIYSEHLDETIDRKITSCLSLLQPVLFSLIAICILAAYVALLLPVYGMIDKL